MTHTELLETEYKEQYNQYRWIGTMQSVVLTFYGAVASFSLLAVVALRPQPPDKLDYRWIAAVFVADGLLGIFTGAALFRSRSMQRRTAWYLVCLLDQMTRGIESWIIERTALRYRALCTSGARFSLSDTMNAAFLIALVSGEAFLVIGIGVLAVIQFGLDSTWAILAGVALFAVAVLVTLFVAERYTKAESRRMSCDYLEADHGRGLGDMRRKFGLPDAP
jgi:hypothetical protein